MRVREKNAEAAPPPASVLIVDDHAAIREGLKSALQASSEFEVVGEAPDGAQALEILQARHVDIVILDITLPGSSGPDVARSIRRAAADAAIVVYTMHGEPALLAAMKSAGVTAYVMKGEPLATLLEALRSARAGRTRFPPAASPPVSYEAVDGNGLHGAAGNGTGGSTPAENRVRLLSGREREIFLRLAQGSSVKQAAFDLGLSPKTVETYKYRLMRKLATDNVVELAKLAIRERLVQP